MSRSSLRQSTSVISFFGSVGAAALVTWVVWKLAVEPMSYVDETAQLEIVRRNHEWNEVLLNNLPVLFLFIAVAGSISMVVYQTRFAS